MSLKLYEILCPDGYVKNGYDKSKLSTIFANSMNSSKTPNTDFTHIDNSKSEKISIFEYVSYPKESIFEIYLDENCSPKHLSPETINYLEAYKKTGQLINVVIVASDNLKVSAEEEEILNKITNNFTYK
jgi:hypothetical protein|tara:strand:- start:290 stop:676 length:387 start_codon:yes stop_codon:yes gene_type:complete